MSNLKQRLKSFPYWFYLIRGTAIFFILLAIKTLMGLNIVNMYEDAMLDSTTEFPFWSISLFYLIGTVLLFNSLVHFFTLYDKRSMESFLSERWQKITLASSFKRILRTESFWVETVPVLLFSVLGCTVGWFPEVTHIFSETGVSESFLHALPFIVILPIFFTTSVWCRYEIYRYWNFLQRGDELYRLKIIPKLIFKALGIIFLYIFFFTYVPMFFIAMFGGIGMLLYLGNYIAILIIILSVAALLAIIVFFRAMRSLSKRKKLIKELKRVCKESEYNLSEIKRPYASLFRHRRECNFTLEKNGKKFSCHFIGSYWQRAPLYFISDKEAYFFHRIGTKALHVDLLSRFTYDFDGEGDKLLILNPVPKRSFASMDEYIDTQSHDLLRGRLRGKKQPKSSRELAPGDKIWGYVIYNTTSFTNAIDRKCLGRYNGLFD